MAYDIENLNLDDSPIEGIEEAFANWQEPSEFPPPPQPGKKAAIVSNIRDMAQKAGVLTATLDLQIKGGEDDGKPLNFVRLSNKMFERNGVRTSQMLDVLKSAGINAPPHSNKEFAQALNLLLDGALMINLQGDWRAYCSTCAANKLMELTGEVTEDAAKDYLDQLFVTDPNKARKVRADVSKAGTKFRNYKQFPEIAGASPNGNGQVPRKDLVDCPTCGQELRAQFNITRWLKAST